MVVGSYRAPHFRAAAVAFGAAFCVGLSSHASHAQKAAHNKSKPAPSKTAGIPVGAKPASGYVKWTDPKEGAFTVEVPVGWQVAGGTKRVGPTDVRRSVVAQSPDKAMTVIIGDVSLPTFLTIGPLEQSMGAREGTQAPGNGNFVAVYMHYMSATEFNKWYIENALTSVMNDVEALKSQDFPQGARSVEAGLRRSMAGGAFKCNVQASVALTEFSGVDKTTGNRVTGAVMSVTQLLYNGATGNGGTWHANPITVGCLDDEHKGANIKKSSAAALRMQATLRDNPVWAKKEAARQALAVKQNQVRLQAQIRAAQKASRSGGGGGSRYDGHMADYWRRRAQQDAQHHQFINYLRGEKDAVTIDGRVIQIPNE